MTMTIPMKVTKMADLDVANRTDTFFLNNAAVDSSANWFESVMEYQSQLLDSLYFIVCYKDSFNLAFM